MAAPLPCCTIRAAALDASTRALQVRAGRDIEAIQYGSTILAAAKSVPSDDELLQEAVTLLGCSTALCSFPRIPLKTMCSEALRHPQINGSMWSSRMLL